MVTACALLVGGGGFAALMHAGSAPQASPAVTPQVPQGTVDSVALTSASSTRAGLTAPATKQFTTVGVTWNNATVSQIDGTVQVRARSVATGAWTAWRALTPEDNAPSPAQNGRAMRGGTSPMWMGLSNGVEVRVVSAKGTVSLPAGLHVSLVDPNGGGTAPVGYAISTDASASPGATDTGSASGSSSSPSSSPSDTTGATATATDSGSASPSATDTSATDSASPTDSSSASSSSSASASDSSSAAASSSASSSVSASATAAWPSQLPPMSAAYPNCASATPSASASATPPSAPSPMPVNTSSPIPAPPFLTRAQWGANECIRENGYPDYGAQVKVVFVHHTDDPNTYSCSDSAALVRAAYLYHVQVEGWRDIGYNFLVDKCGQIFEGRFGGASLPIVGAQTYGFNTNSMGIAAIGTYTDLSGGDSTASPNPGATPTDSMLRSIAWIAAWKLGMSGIDPVTGKNQLPEGGALATSVQKYPTGQVVTFNAISGHRDGYNTDCPGNQLYNDLAQIRAYAENPITFVDGGAVRVNNSVWVTRSAATVHWGSAYSPAQISGFDVLDNGVVRAHVGPTANQASISLTGGGTHQLQVQTDLVAGGTVKSAQAPVVVDTTAPTFPTAPSTTLRTGTVTRTSVPVTLNWRAADNVGLASLGVYAPASTGLPTTWTSWNTTALPGAWDLFGLRATDYAGNTTSASVWTKPALALAAAASRSGAWTYSAGAGNLGGYAYASASRGASMTYTFTGRSVAWIATRARWAGQAWIYVDGSYAGTVDLYNGTTANSQAAWTRTWSASGLHHVKIVVVGTSGRPWVPTEGFATLG